MAHDLFLIPLIAPNHNVFQVPSHAKVNRVASSDLLVFNVGIRLLFCCLKLQVLIYSKFAIIFNGRRGSSL